MFYHVGHSLGHRHQLDLVDRALQQADLGHHREDQQQTDIEAPRREEGVLVEADEGYKTIHMRHDPTTLAHRRHRGEDGDRARSRDHRREGLHQDEAQQEGAQEEEARQQGDEEAQATVLEVVTAGAGVAHGVNPELGVDMAAGDEIAIK